MRKFEVGQVVTFGEIWDGEGNALELLASTAVETEDGQIVDFNVVTDFEDFEDGIDILEVEVEITDIR